MRKAIVVPWAVTALLALLAAAVGTLGLAANKASAAFPGQNGDILFDLFEVYGGEIFTMSPTGDNLHKLGEGYYPAWSPNGQKILFGRDLDGVQDTDDSELFMMNKNGKGVRRLTYKGGAEAAWSPDGRKIAFVREGEIYVMDANGKKVRRLTDNFVDDRTPAWSPDGTKIVFQSSPYDAESPPFNLYAMNPDGTGRQRLTTDPERYDANPNWSPDGTKIVFVGVSGDPGEEEGGVWTMNADGTDQRVLRPGDDPAWSPDGTKIAYMGVDVGVGYTGVWTMNADGTEPRQLTTDGGTPDWGPRPRSTAGDRPASKAQTSLTHEAPGASVQ